MGFWGGCLSGTLGVSSFTRPASVSTAKLGPSASFKHFSVCRQLSAPSSPQSAPYPHCLSVLMSSCCPNSAHSFAATLVSPRAQSNLRPFQLAATSACIALPHISSWLPRLLLVFTRSSHLICEVHPDPPLQFNSANSLPAQLFSSFSPTVFTILLGNEGSGSNFLSCPPSMTSGMENRILGARFHDLRASRVPISLLSVILESGMRRVWGWLLGVPEEIQGDTKEAPFQFSLLLWGRKESDTTERLSD